MVVQEVYPDGLIAMDGRLQPGDQIIEINGVDMTCAPHQQVRLFINVMVGISANSGNMRSRLRQSQISKQNNFIQADTLKGHLGIFLTWLFQNSQVVHGSSFIVYIQII